MDADVGHVPAGADQLGGQLERAGHADRLDRDVGTEPVGEFHHAGARVFAAVVDRGVGAELAGALQARVGEVDGDDASRRVELGGQDRREPDGSRADDRDDVARRGPCR